MRETIHKSLESIQLNVPSGSRPTT